MQLIFRTLAVATILFAAASGVVAQTSARQVSGTVTSDLGTAVAGARVCVKGTGNYVTSDSNGKFSINAQEGDTLVFSNDGYATTEMTVGGDDKMDAQMVVEDVFALDLADLMNTEVQSSSFLTLKAKEAPGFIFSLDMGEQRAQHSLIEIAKMTLPSFSDGSHPDTETFGVRGMKMVDNSKSMVMYDGQNLNMRSNIGYGIGLSSMLLGDVKTLEVSLGPNAIVHGSGAISGYVNMVPKNGYDNGGLSVDVSKEFEHAADNQASAVSRAEVSYGFGSQRRNAFFYAGWYHSDGWTADSAFQTKRLNAALIGQHPFGDTPKANFRLSANANLDDWSLNAGYMQNSRSSFSSAKEATHQTLFTRQFNARLKWSRDLSDHEHLTVAVSNELTDLGRHAASLAGGSESHIEAKVVATTKRWDNNQLAVGGLAGWRKFRAGEFFFGHDIDPAESPDASYERNAEDGNYFQIIDSQTGKKRSDPAHLWASAMTPNGKWNEFAVFAEDVYKLGDNLVFALGLRFDCFKVKAFDDTQSNLSPRVAASWSIDDANVLKASYQQGFRTADFFNMGQTYWQKTPQVEHALVAGGMANGFKFDVKPEKLHSFEVNYHGDFFSGKVLSVDVNAFFNRYKDMIDFTTLCNWNSDDYLADKGYVGDYTPTGKAYFTAEQRKVFMPNFLSKSYLKNPGRKNSFSAYVNSCEDIDIVGGEVIATASLPSATKVTAAYSVAKSTTSSYADKSLAPTHQLKAGATQNLFADRLIISAQLLWEPAVEDNDKNRMNYMDVYFDPRTLLDAKVSYAVADHFRIYVSANNLLGEDRPCVTFKPDAENNYPELTNLGCGERRFWVGVRVDL